MTIPDQITNYISSLPEPKKSEILELHERILIILSETRLWFFDGTDDNGKIVANPNIGYGYQLMKYADGRTREWFQIGISGNTSGISVYVLGIEDKTYLKTTYGETIGKATVTGYCIKFKSIKNINLGILDKAILDGVAKTKS